MSEHRFFIPPAQVQGKAASVTGSDVKHIRNVLRLKVGHKVTLLDGQGQEHLARITEVTPEQVDLEIIESFYRGSPSRKIILIQGIPKSTKMDLIVQKTTELGIDRIIPVVFERTVARPGEKTGAKRERWQRISREAAGQSRRLTVPEVMPPCDFATALRSFPKYDQVMVFWETGPRQLVGDVLDVDAKKLALVIGPEGGLTQTEVEKMVALGAKIVTIGDLTLRTETAAIAALAIVSYELQRQKKQLVTIEKKSC